MCSVLPIVLALLGMFVVDGTTHSEETLWRIARIPPTLACALEPVLFAALWLSYMSLKAVTGEFLQLQVRGAKCVRSRLIMRF